MSILSSIMAWGNSSYLSGRAEAILGDIGGYQIAPDEVAWGKPILRGNPVR
jgi:hypothetical protein